MSSQENLLCWADLSHSVQVMAATSTLARTGVDSQLADAAGRLLRLLADPTRMAILRLLAQGERTVTELVDLLGTPRSRLGNHLACGLHCGVWTSKKQGRHVVYSLADPAVLSLLEHAERVAGPHQKHLAGCTRLGPAWI